MSEKDKTTEKLINSIRKTREGSDTAAVKTAKKATQGTKSSKPRATAARKTPARKPATKAALKKSSTQVVRQQVITMATKEENPYPDGSQVWPD